MSTGWNLELACKPDFPRCMERVHAWYEQEVLDRAPVRFSEHNAAHRRDGRAAAPPIDYAAERSRWFDVERQISAFRASIRGRRLLGETFPVYYPNLGPGFYAACYGSELTFSDVTSWTSHFIDDLASFDFHGLRLNTAGDYWRTMEALMDAALTTCEGEFMVGYTDLHPSVDCVVDWYGPERLCLAMLEQPEAVHRAIDAAFRDFERVFRHYHDRLATRRQPSASWMAIPFFGPMHIPSCDFASLVSPALFEEFCLPNIQAEARLADYNIFHVDGPGVVRHIDALLEVPEIRAFQLVQGVGADAPIMQWIPFIRKVQAAGRSLVISLTVDEVESFVDAVGPKGIFLTLEANVDEQERMLARLLAWS